LSDIFSNRDSSGWISKWAIELSEHVVEFEKRSAIKSHIIADFITEWMKPNLYMEGQVPESPWLIYYGGASSSAGARATAILISPSGIKLRYTIRLQFIKETGKCTNNITEYEVITVLASQVKSHRSSKMHPENRFEGGI
jgi:hypothetical protein